MNGEKTFFDKHLATISFTKKKGIFSCNMNAIKNEFKKSRITNLRINVNLKRRINVVFAAIKVKKKQKYRK